MLSIKVLGPGCVNCERVEQYALEALGVICEVHPDLDVAFEKVTDVNRFPEYGLLATPGLVINERLVSSGRIPTPGLILSWMEEALAA